MHRYSNCYPLVRFLLKKPKMISTSNARSNLINIIFLLGPISVPRAAIFFVRLTTQKVVILSMARIYVFSLNSSQHWFIFGTTCSLELQQTLRVEHSFHLQLMDCRLQLLHRIKKNIYDSTPGILGNINHMDRITYHSWLSGRIKTMLFVTFSALYTVTKHRNQCLVECWKNRFDWKWLNIFEQCYLI